MSGSNFQCRNQTMKKRIRVHRDCMQPTGVIHVGDSREAVAPFWAESYDVHHVGAGEVLLEIAPGILGQNTGGERTKRLTAFDPCVECRLHIRDHWVWRGSTCCPAPLVQIRFAPDTIR